MTKQQFDSVIIISVCCTYTVQIQDFSPRDVFVKPWIKATSWGKI